MTNVFNWFKLDEKEYKLLVDCAWIYSYEDYIDQNPSTPVSKEQFDLFVQILNLQFDQDMLNSKEANNLQN